MPEAVSEKPSATAVVVAARDRRLSKTRENTAVDAPRSSSDAATELAAALRDAVGKMDADDVTIEFDATKDGDRSNVRLRFRAYRRTQP